MRQCVSAAVLATAIAATSPCLAQTQDAPAPAEGTTKPDDLLFKPLRLKVDPSLAPWVAAFQEKDHPEVEGAALAAAEDSGSRSGQTQAAGDFTLFGRDLTLLITQFAGGAWNGMPLWMNELVVHFARPRDRKGSESTFVVGVIGKSSAPAAPVFSYRLAW
jgi:hypothetical protein